MNLIGERVTSARYGKGTIVSIDGSYMTVQFSEKSSKFKYPDAFQKHIFLVNEALQVEMNTIATVAVEEKERAGEKEKVQKYREIMQSVEEARMPAKKEPSNKTTAPRKKASSSEKNETIKWDLGKRRTYYVFQGGSFNDEYAGGYIWAPYESRYGMKFHYWDRLKDLHKGDMLFHADHGKIRAISIVREPHVVAARPVEELVGMYEGDNRGYLVYCDYTLIEDPISAWDYTDQTKKYSRVKYAPFNINGTGNLGYLYELDQRLATLFLEESVKKNPALGEIDFVKEFLK